ncbi:IS630 family transposase [bacterium]|nr:IS630 family transposase [bacterium]
MRVAPPIELSETLRKKLLRFSKASNVSAKLCRRSKIILLAAEGHSNKSIAAKLGIDQPQVGRWRKRFAELGLPGIEKDAPRPGRIEALGPEKESEVIHKTLHAKPRGATHWSRSLMAKEVGISETSVGKIWARNGLKPHLHKTFKISNDPKFEEKLCDIVGLYLSPPENALVFSCDEKSQIQALDRTQPGLPLKRGRAQTMTHDYKRNGTSSLFSALEVATGKVIATCQKQHRHLEWLKFLKLIKKSVEPGKDIHIICDNYATHKHAKVKEWLMKNPRIHMHFTPTSASWLNMVERFFRDITERCIRSGVFHSVADLEEAILGYIEIHNENPKPFIWTAQASDILEKVKRAKSSLVNSQSA